MSFKNLTLSAVFSVSLIITLATASNARADLSPTDHVWVQALGQNVANCVIQPYGINTRTGNKIFGSLRSVCADLVISLDRAELRFQGRDYTILIKDSEMADGGDFNDLYVQFDSREDQEVEIGKNLLSFGDPVYSLMMLTGHKAEELPQIQDAGLNQAL